MKKVLSILLALALLLPAAALADTLELGPFTLETPANVEVETAEKADGSVIAMLSFKDKDGTYTGNNMNVVWSEAQMGLSSMSVLSTLPQSMLNSTVKKYAENMLAATIDMMDTMGVTVNRYELLDAGMDLDRGMFFMGYSVDAHYDLFGGFDMSNVVYQYSIDVEGDGAYLFTLTANTLEELDELIDCFNTLR